MTSVPSPDAPRHVVLDNGLTVLVQEVHTAPLASVWAWYRVGSRDELPGQTGVSHWVEHMNFKGTTHIPRDQVKGIIERFGGGWNGYTWLDQTAYLETATREALDQMLFIESERMGSCLYDPADCESERTVIVSELQGGENDPEALLDREVTAAAFDVHPYRHPTIGWIDDLRAMTRDQLYGHYRRYYVPNNATLVVVGDVRTDDVLRRVEERFGSIAPGPTPPRAAVTERPQAAERRVTLRRPGTAAYLLLAYRAPAFEDPDFFPMLVLDAVLTGAKGLNLWSSFRVAPPQRTARLYRALVEPGLAAVVSGSLVPTREPFLYTLAMTVGGRGTLSSLESAALEAIALAGSDLTEGELTKARAQLRARLVFDDESITQIAHQLGYYETIASVDAYRELRHQIEAVTPAELQEVARRRLVPSQLTVGWFEPAGDEPTQEAGAA